MLNLPQSTEMSKQLPKKAIYTKFQMNTPTKEKIDADISRMIIVNEVSADKIGIAGGETVKSFYVILISLKRKEFDEKSIITVSKLIEQNILFILEFGRESKLAVYHNKLLQSQWKPTEEHSVPLQGLNLDKVWENIIISVGGLNIEQENTLDEQIALDEKRAKLKKEIARLEKQARAEKQPRKKFELVQKIRNLKMRN